MRDPRSLRDATNTVSIGDARAVADATDRILTASFGAGTFDKALLHASFALVERLYAGEEPGYLACDMPYHDLRHSLDTALVMARLVEGFRIDHGASAGELTPDLGVLGVVLALLHDTGFIRKTSEASLCGAELMSEHESRSVEFAQAYLRTTSLARHAALASLIQATRLATDLDRFFAGYEGAAALLGRMLGSADLLSQVSDADYPERCYYHLYPELVLGGCDRMRAPDGTERVLYGDALGLLGNTPRFYESVVSKRLERDFKDVARHLAARFGGADDPYADAIRRNLERVERVVREARVDLLGREPVTTTRDLAAAFTRLRASPPRGPPSAPAA